MTEREAFEAWYGGDAYDVDNPWEAWQASRKVALEDAAQACEELSVSYGSIANSGLFTDAGRTLHDGMYGGAHNCAAAIKGLK